MQIQVKREAEKQLVSQMIALYCHRQHRTRRALCPDCAELAAYARSRSDQCPFMETKTFCVNCRVHCYRTDMRARIRQVMRFSGPRMLLLHPIVTMRHLIAVRREARQGKGFSSC